VHVALPHDVHLHACRREFDACMQRVLPDGVPVPSSFETVGHVAHFNLRAPHLPYRRLIGQVCIDKNAAVRTVVHKTGDVGSEFRVFAMELLAGAQRQLATRCCAPFCVCDKAACRRAAARLRSALICLCST
jgi:tRNA G37 N-methylase Trm5